MQISVFDGAEPFKIDKPIRLTEMFAGFGTQSLALKYLGVPFESYKCCEWEVNAIKAYKALHFGNDTTDYSADKSKSELVGILAELGISNDGKVPMDKKSIARKGEKWLRETYNNIKATHNLVDITKAKGKDLAFSNGFCDIVTYSFPCTDLSLAGNQKGMDRESGTRSGLLWEVERILNECNTLPKILVMENVTQVHGTKNKHNFDEWCKFLESKGYKSFWKDLNGKCYCIPQNRDRTFMVSILDFDGEYSFPKQQVLRYKLKDILEPSVDEKYYISNAMVEYITANNEKWTGNNNKVLINKSIASTIDTGEGSRRCDASDFITDGLPEDYGLKQAKINIVGKTKSGGQRSFILGTDGLSSCLSATDYKQPKQIKLEQVGSLINPPYDKMHESSCRVYDNEGLAPTINTCGGGNLEPKIIEPQLVGGVGEINFGTQYRQGNRIYDSEAVACALGASPVGNAGGYSYLYKVAEPTALDEQNKYIRQDGCIGCLTTDGSSPKHNNRVIEPTIQNYRIRKLTPTECLRLMAVKDTDIEKLKNAGLSNSALYKLAGNSIIVTCLMGIFGQMIGDCDWQTKINELANEFNT